MPPSAFDTILGLVRDRNKKEDTNLRKAIPPDVRLALTISISCDLDTALKTGSYFTILANREQLKHVISKDKKELSENIVKVDDALLQPEITDIISAASYRCLKQEGVLKEGDATLVVTRTAVPCSCGWCQVMASLCCIEVGEVAAKAGTRVGPPRVACDVNHRTHYVTCATGVVYQIPLSCGRVYIGQTGRCINVYAFHFHDSFIVRKSIYRDPRNGKTIETALPVPRPDPAAVPSIFKGCPSHLSKPECTKAREEPQLRPERLESSQLAQAVAD
ncbi:hypothetical protein HPB47_025983 [Ixodes persulcatus]|uniref:Uncharacterized protein n=1 Tax=Ixodes persulcatus TaxID=34615 RepID=A0AC60Q1P2_IXOPE|nr:hypothetical protein HPB47_025983 [Ixodes persulcatus]